MVSTDDPAARWLELIRSLEAGDEIIVVDEGRPVAKLVALQPERPERLPGRWAGKVEIAADVVGPNPDAGALFHGDDAPASGTG